MNEKVLAGLATKLRSLELTTDESELLAVILERAAGADEAEVEGFDISRMSLGFKGSDEELQFKGSDEELQFKGSDEELQALLGRAAGLGRLL